MGLLHLIVVVADLASKRHTFAPDPYPPAPSQPSAFGPGLLFFGGVLLVALIAYLAYAAQRARRQGFQRMATQLGLSYSRADPLGLLDYPFTLFTKGDRRTVENVVFGAWQEVEVVAFDFMYTEGSGKSQTDYHFDCVIVPIAADSPRLLIEHETLLTSLAGALSFHDQQFESEAFNKEYRVHCEVPKFANDVLDARMMEWLLANGYGYMFEVVGEHVLVAGPRIEPADLLGLLGVGGGFTQHVPKVVSSLYPG
ncbi:MAG TPA: hypothetical protein VGQ50_02975 [Actinomycetota bacterium]|jgi:hypothetical protein|nr:hypothetical protein [Actinomycetota bacterium]